MSDPNYRDPSAYEYGTLREITLHVILSDAILWSYSIKRDGREHICGGFSGPFEALAHALQMAKEERTH